MYFKLRVNIRLIKIRLNSSSFLRTRVSAIRCNLKYKLRSLIRLKTLSAVGIIQTAEKPIILRFIDFLKFFIEQ